jgi:hypothetical protein
MSSRIKKENSILVSIINIDLNLELNLPLNVSSKHKENAILERKIVD